MDGKRARHLTRSLAALALVTSLVVAGACSADTTVDKAATDKRQRHSIEA